jgi:hypothetical protein
MLCGARERATQYRGSKPNRPPAKPDRGRHKPGRNHIILKTALCGRAESTYWNRDCEPEEAGHLRRMRRAGKTTAEILEWARRREGGREGRKPLLPRAPYQNSNRASHRS